ncbi:MAG: Nif11-like leader peptide family natural product precursor [Azoarcus sp.]|jgi:predicted ribosomally synthesized peptide with nif11-like leader|nr:Nif11-like leader peptide family natural product precursor [Azoarcus sp.]
MYGLEQTSFHARISRIRRIPATWERLKTYRRERFRTFSNATARIAPWRAPGDAMARLLREPDVFISREERAVSIESAIAYINRMREDENFRRTMNAFDGNEAAWLYLREQGFAFSLDEFKKARDEVYKAHGITPM